MIVNFTLKVFILANYQYAYIVLYADSIIIKIIKTVDFQDIISNGAISKNNNNDRKKR